LDERCILPGWPPTDTSVYHQSAASAAAAAAVADCLRRVPSGLALFPACWITTDGVCCQYLASKKAVLLVGQMTAQGMLLLAGSPLQLVRS
jgi:hypothetical protein